MPSVLRGGGLLRCRIPAELATGISRSVGRQQNPRLFRRVSMSGTMFHEMTLLQRILGRVLHRMLALQRSMRSCARPMPSSMIRSAVRRAAAVTAIIITGTGDAGDEYARERRAARLNRARGKCLGL